MSDSHGSHAPAPSGGNPVPHKVPGGITRGRLAVIGAVILAVAVIIVGVSWKSDDDKPASQEAKAFTAPPPNPNEASGFAAWLMKSGDAVDGPKVPAASQPGMDCPTVPVVSSFVEPPKPVAAVVPSQFYHLTVATMQVGEAGYLKVCGNVATCDKRRAWILESATVLPTAPVGQEKEYVLVSRLATGLDLNFGQRTDPLPMIQGPPGSKPGDKLLGWVPVTSFTLLSGGKG